MKAYWFDNAPVGGGCMALLVATVLTLQGDHRLPHDSGRPVSSETLAQLGVLHHYYTSLEDVDRLAAARGYKNRDEVTVSPASMGDAYEAKVRIFFDEHLHEDEEIRYLLDGSGFFDVRSAGDAWIRIALAAGDLVVLPPGIYHRFTPDARDVRPPAPAPPRAWC